MLIEFVTTEKVRPLRHQVLRPNQTFDETLYPLDGHPKTIHVAMIDNGEIVGICSFYNEDSDGNLETKSWRIRGMAVSPEHQSNGIGRMILEYCVKFIKSQGAEEVWCNARTTAVPFYEKSNFVKQGDEFEITGIGPHYILKKTL